MSRPYPWELNGAAIALADLPQVDPIAESRTDGTTSRPAGTTSRQRAPAPTSPGSTPIIDNNLSEGNVIALVERDDWALSYTGTIQAMV